MADEMKWFKKMLAERENEMKSLEKLDGDLKEIVSKMPEPFPTHRWVTVHLTRKYDPIADEWYDLRKNAIISTLHIDQWYYLKTKKVLCCYVAPRTILKLAKNPFVEKIEVSQETDVPIVQIPHSLKS